MTSVRGETESETKTHHEPSLFLCWLLSPYFIRSVWGSVFLQLCVQSMFLNVRLPWPHSKHELSEIFALPLTFSKAEICTDESNPPPPPPSLHPSCTCIFLYLVCFFSQGILTTHTSRGPGHGRFTPVLASARIGTALAACSWLHNAVLTLQSRAVSVCSLLPAPPPLWYWGSVHTPSWGYRSICISPTESGRRRDNGLRRRPRRWVKERK